MDTHIGIALEEIKNIATFNSNAKIFDQCLVGFLTQFKIRTIKDVKNLRILAENKNLKDLHIDSNGQLSKTENDKEENHVKLFVENTQDIDCQTLEDAARFFINNNKQFTEEAKYIIEKINNNPPVPDEFEKVKEEFLKKDTPSYEEYRFCNEQGNYKSQFIQYVTSIKNTDISGTVQKICYHFIKSFLNAEFLILDDFSKKIEDTRKYIKNYYNGDNFANMQKGINPSFYIIKSFFKICYYVEEMCKTHDHYLKNSNKKLICVNTDRKSRFNSTPKLSQIDFIIGKKTVLPYEWLMESIVDATIIDLDYIVTNKNIDKLFRLWHRIAVVEGLITNREAWKPVFSILKTKTAILLENMINSQKNKDKIDYEIVNIDEEAKKKITEHHNKFIEKAGFSSHPFIEIIKNKKDQKLYYSEFNVLLQNTSYKNKNDIDSYDKYAKESIEIYCNNSPYFKKIDENSLSDDDVDHLSNLLKQDNHKHFNSQTLFIKLIENLNNDIKNKLKKFTYESTIKIEKRLNLLSNLLIEMERFTERAKTNKVKQFMPVFAYSFYAVENGTVSFAGDLKDKIENYDINNKTDFNNYCFIASAGLVPVNILYLETEIIKWKINIQELNFEYDHILSKGVAEGAKEVTKKQIERMSEENKQKQQDTQKETITILGVFAALLAFVTASIGLIKIAHNLFEYAVFSVIFTSALLIFIVAINLVRTQQENKYYWKHLVMPLLIICLMIGVLFLLSKCSGLKENNKGEQETEIPNKVNAQMSVQPKQNLNGLNSPLTNEENQ
jgi:hypothetical protein